MQLNKNSHSKNQLFSNQKYYFHINSRTKDDSNFEPPMDLAWELCIDKLHLAFKLTRIDINGFVLMNNHYHLIIRATLEELSEFMQVFQMSFLENFHYDVIRSQKYLHHAYRYIYQNPLRANLCKRVQDYPYSLLYKLYHYENIPFPVIDKFGIVDDYKLYWLNQEV